MLDSKNHSSYPKHRERKKQCISQNNVGRLFV